MKINSKTSFYLKGYHFLAPIGAQEVTLSVCLSVRPSVRPSVCLSVRPSGTKCSRAPYLHLSGSNLQSISQE